MKRDHFNVQLGYRAPMSLWRRAWRAALPGHESHTREEFLEWLSHEVRTPTTVVAGLASILRQRGNDFDPCERDEIYADLDEQARRLVALVEDLFVLARSEDEQVITEPVLVAPVLQNEASWCKEQYGIALHIEPNAAAIAVASPDHLRHTIRCILRAMAITKSGGDTVSIACTNNKDTVRTTVSSIAKGPPGQVKTALAPFFGSRRRWLTQGTPLAATLARQLVENQGGNVGGGLHHGKLHLWFTLPLAKEA
jgi:K+-sensing histidine kinase KdpD